MFGNFVRKILKPFSLDIVRYEPQSHSHAQRAAILRNAGIEAFLDVGANRGQTGQHLRQLGYVGKIISFEPTSEAFQKLQSVAANDADWRIFNCGIGAEDKNCKINLSYNSASSSLLELTELGHDSCERARFVGTEEIEIQTLAAIHPRLGIDGKKTCLKIDTQGFEKQVLNGAIPILENIDLIQIEMSLQTLYAGEILLLPMMNHLHSIGYSLIAVESGLVDPKSAATLQVDGLFCRNAA